MYFWSVLSALSGGSTPQRMSISFSAETTVFAWTTSAANTRRWRDPPMGITPLLNDERPEDQELTPGEASSTVGSRPPAGRIGRRPQARLETSTANGRRTGYQRLRVSSRGSSIAAGGQPSARNAALGDPDLCVSRRVSQRRRLSAGALAVRAPWPAAGPTLAFL
jgi:hypothetical protein